MKLIIAFFFLPSFLANISATEIRRQKLSYQDLSTYTAETAKAWDDLIAHKNNEKIDKQILLELVRGGVPRARRGEIWQFLVKQNAFCSPDSSEKQRWKETPYRTLLKRNSGHQHAILIDLGKLSTYSGKFSAFFGFLGLSK